ncbi:hypothetical protein HS1genome_0599 [Sulfodiicoccus acidiphilus]|uniref:DUF1404 domain-containing protein n=1 Tax=Sulfodiicoccus acidiphilus TaxID=1670455 RepID=A0A348B208_9CREN|nr:DUF1404 family protein [Sulfodiicoccus acidiphilus]BBD72210.1 hypothetical protein HS1genome_0599 [Sulfodiicoccus acidiphilus]GGU03016.1 hypothetical protein GCM10007116_20040 [Sulfodiicoccus acidiphilus]
MREKTPYLILGAVMVAASVNPLSVSLDRTSEIAKTSFDMVLVWGAGLVGIWLAELLFRKGGRITAWFLSFNFSTRGLFLSWGVAGALLTYWYIPGPFALSVLYLNWKVVQLATFTLAGIIAGIGWYGMTNVWRSATIFAIFSMMATMAEIFLELGAYYSENVYSVYPVSQFIDTAYLWFAMAFVPSTFYMVKILKDMGIF